VFRARLLSTLQRVPSAYHPEGWTTNVFSNTR
jgi:hypothetical protein